MQNIMDFSITQILREIVSRKIKVSKTDSFIASVRFCQNSFLQIDQIKYFRASKIVWFTVLAPLKSSKLISYIRNLSGGKILWFSHCEDNIQCWLVHFGLLLSLNCLEKVYEPFVLHKPLMYKSNKYNARIRRCCHLWNIIKLWL